MVLRSPNPEDWWPHQFTKNGKGYELPPDDFGIPRYAQTYICVHCFNEYIQNFEDPEWIHEQCPARYKEREMKRILS